MKNRVVVVDDHASIRQMLGMVLSREGPYEMVGEAGSGFEALKVCRKLKPRLVVLTVVSLLSLLFLGKTTAQQRVIAPAPAVPAQPTQTEKAQDDKNKKPSV